MALRAAAAAPLLVRLLSLCPALLAGTTAGTGGRVQLWQPQAALAVLVGQTLTLSCTVSEGAPAGPVKWLKASGGRNRTVYDQKSPWPRVARATNGSNTDFTILIRDAGPDDAGTYYCVKQRADAEDQVACSGGGTTVSVHERSLFPSVAVAVATVTLSLLLLFLVALCVYRRHRAGGGSPSAQEPDGTTAAAAAQGCPAADGDVHYADLQPLPAAPRRAPACAAASEYASIQRAAP